MLYDKQPGGVVGVQDQDMVEELIIDGDDHIQTMVSVSVVCPSEIAGVFD